VLILAGVATVFVGERFVYGGRPYINLVQAINLAGVGAALLVIRDPVRRSFNLRTGFGAFVLTIVATGAVGVLPW
jgi:hypothetical protein